MRVDGKVNASKNTKTTETPKIHNVTILDGSGSMGGSKYDNARKGIQLDFETCKKEDFKTFTFVEFNNGGSDITTHCFMEKFDKVNLIFNGARGGTPLYETIGVTLERLLKEVPKNDKVLVKVFTDGEENASSGTYANVGNLKSLIKQCESQGFTITFIGTEHDTNFIIRNLGLDKSNTLVHDNTGEGVQMSFQTQAFATVQYRKSLDEGEDVSVGFYSKVLNN